MYPIRTGPKPPPQDVSVQDASRRLTGQEGESNPGAAVTRGAVGALGIVKLQSSTVTGSPSAADHNALIADIRLLANILNGLGANITIP